MSGDRPFGQIVSLLRSLEINPSFRDVDALMVGGSSGRGDATTTSDLDLFALAMPGRIRSVLRRDVDEIFRAIGPIILFRGPVWVDDFGYSFTGLYDKGHIVQLNVNSANTLRANPMNRQPHNMLFDRTGRYTRFLARPVRQDARVQRKLEASAVFCMLRLLFACDALSKGEMWLAIKQLQDARDAWFLLLRLAHKKPAVGHNYNNSAKKIELDLGAVLDPETAVTLPEYSNESIAKAIRSLAKILLDGLHEIDTCLCSNKDALLHRIEKSSAIISTKLQ